MSVPKKPVAMSEVVNKMKSVREDDLKYVDDLIEKMNKCYSENHKVAIMVVLKVFPKVNLTASLKKESMEVNDRLNAISIRARKIALGNKEKVKQLEEKMDSIFDNSLINSRHLLSNVLEEKLKVEQLLSTQIVDNERLMKQNKAMLFEIDEIKAQIKNQQEIMGEIMKSFNTFTELKENFPNDKATTSHKSDIANDLKDVLLETNVFLKNNIYIANKYNKKYSEFEAVETQLLKAKTELRELYVERKALINLKENSQRTIDNLMDQIRRSKIDKNFLDEKKIDMPKIKKIWNNSKDKCYKEYEGEIKIIPADLQIMKNKLYENLNKNDWEMVGDLSEVSLNFESYTNLFKCLLLCCHLLCFNLVEGAKSLSKKIINLLSIKKCRETMFLIQLHKHGMLSKLRVD